MSNKLIFDLLRKEYADKITIDPDNEHLASPDIPYQQFVPDIVAALEPYFAKATHKYQRLNISHREDHVDFFFLSTNPLALSFSVGFKDKEYDLYIPAMSIEDPELRGKGIPQNLLKAMIKSFYPQKSSKIDILYPVAEAMYSWVKHYGFLTDKKHWEILKKDVQERLKNLDIKPETKQAIKAILKSDRPESLRDLAALDNGDRYTLSSYSKHPYTVGFLLLFGTRAPAITLDLKDKASRDILEKRLGTTLHELISRDGISIKAQPNTEPFNDLSPDFNPEKQDNAPKKNTRQK